MGVCYVPLRGAAPKLQKKCTGRSNPEHCHVCGYWRASGERANLVVQLSRYYFVALYFTILRKPCSTVNHSNFTYMCTPTVSCTDTNEIPPCMSFMGYTAVLRTTAGRFACCWLAHNAVHSDMTIVDTSTVLNLEEEENMKNSAHHCTMVPVPVVLVIHVVLSRSKPTPYLSPMSDMQLTMEWRTTWIFSMYTTIMSYSILIIHTHGHYACTLPHPADQSFVNTVQKLRDVQSQFPYSYSGFMHVDQ